MRSANGDVGVLDWRREFADGEGVEAAETGLEFGGGQAAIAIERAEKVGGGMLSFLGIAFEAAGNQVAVGVARSRQLTAHSQQLKRSLNAESTEAGAHSSQRERS